MSEPKRKMTLPTDSQARKEYPILSGFLKYFPAAIAGAANLSKLGNDKHNPGEELHHARGKSMDHGDCIVRHLMDMQDLIAADNRAEVGALLRNSNREAILLEASSLVWRSLAYAQELHEKYGAPLAPAAREAEETKSAPPEPTYYELTTSTGVQRITAEQYKRYVQTGKIDEAPTPSEPRPYYSHTDEELLGAICKDWGCGAFGCVERKKELKRRGIKYA